MEPIWLKSYPASIPPVINADAYSSLLAIFEQSCQQYAASYAYYNMNVFLTYREIEAYTRDFAAYLQQSLQVKKGDRLAIMLPNVLQYPITLFSAMRAGLIIVNVNPLYTTDELIHQLNDSGAETIVVLSSFAATVARALPKVPKLKNIIVSEIGDFLPRWKACAINFTLKYVLRKIPPWHIARAISFKRALIDGRGLSLLPVTLHNEDIAFLQYTGGTTGISKGAILTHRNIIANLQQADEWFKGLWRNRQEIIITALPLYHIFSLTANCLFFFKIGGLNVLITNPRHTSGMVKEMKKFKFNAITGVNTLFSRLLKNKQFASLDFSGLHLTLGGGMAVQRIVAEQWEKVTHVPLLEAYGLTETSPCVTINPITIKSYNGTVGLPVSSTEVCILDEDGKELGINEAGELAVKGPQVMRGYWQNHGETSHVFTKDGWLLTGDIASIDAEGFVRILERKKDMILVSGFNVYPNEVEDVIARLNGVQEVAVIGVKDENSGEAVKAFIMKDKPELKAEQVIDFCRAHMTAYKVPKYVEFRDELPKTSVGKIMRRALKVK